MKDERRGINKDSASIISAGKASGRPSSIERFKSARPSPITMVLLALLILLSSCGYRFSGTGDIVPSGMNTISVPVFLNATNEPFVDVEVTRAVVEEFLTDGRLKIASLEEADLALRGRVTFYEAIPLSYNAESYVQQYRVRLVVAARLEDLGSKKILWEEAGIEAGFIADYTVATDDIKTTRMTKDLAIKKASQDIAWTLRSRVLEGF